MMEICPRCAGQLTKKNNGEATESFPFFYTIPENAGWSQADISEVRSKLSSKSGSLMGFAERSWIAVFIIGRIIGSPKGISGQAEIPGQQRYCRCLELSFLDCLIGTLSYSMIGFDSSLVDSSWLAVLPSPFGGWEHWAFTHRSALGASWSNRGLTDIRAIHSTLEILQLCLDMHWYATLGWPL